jgi:hypothetical protein
MAEKRKMFFRGGLGFPIVLGSGGIRFDPARLPEYYANNERGPGGWYPLGAIQTWHNGIHLHASGAKRTVHAIADGTVVAARLTEDWDEKTHPFGSNCFVLLKHQLSLIDDPNQRRSWDTDTWSSVRDVTFYSLYMHLEPKIEKLDEVPWLKSYKAFLRNGLKYQGEVWRVKKRDGTAVKLYAEPKPVDGQIKRPPATTDTTPVGSLIELLGDPVEAQLGAQHHVYQHVKVIDPEAGRDGWKDGWIRIEGGRIEQTDAQRIIRDLQNGAVAYVGCTVHAGDCIGHAGPLAAEGAAGDPDAGRGVHVELFSADNLVTNATANGWTVCKDTSADDVICEDRALLGQIEAVDPSFAANLKSIWNRIFGKTISVARREYEEHLSAEDKAKLRRIITQNTSFWAIDWKKMAKRKDNSEWCESYGLKEKGKDKYKDDVLDAATRYSWWLELPPKAKEQLPGKTLLFHYHPLEFLNYLQVRVPRPPVFFLPRKEGGKQVEYVVSKVDHLEPSILDTVWVYEPHFPDEQPARPDEWILEKRKYYPFAVGDRQVPSGTGTVAGWVGLGFDGTPLLYDGLIANPHEGLLKGVTECAQTTGISADDLKKTWAAIWHSEGGLNAFNSYDNGHLSVGALQQIAGPVFASGAFQAEGELGAAMHAVKSAGGDGAGLFRQFFGQYGFDTGATHTVASATAATRTLAFDTAPPSPGGATEVKALSDLAKARWFIWSWCVKRALQDPEFIRLFYAYGFTRLKIVRDLVKQFGTIADHEDVTLGRLLKTQLAQALVLDWHINSPLNAIPGWSQAAVGVDQMAFGKNVDWTTFDADREYKIIKNIVDGRRPTFKPDGTVKKRSMTDGPRRSAFIVLCTRSLSYAGRNQPYSQASWTTWSTSNDAFLKKIGYPGGGLQLLWEANHDDTVPYPATAPTLTIDNWKVWTKVLDHTYDFLEHVRT